MEDFEGEIDNAYFEAVNLMNGYDVTAFVENEEDISFWTDLCVFN